MSTYSLPPLAAEALAFEEKILPNGLCLRVVPMPEYSSAHVIYSTGFGAIHRRARLAGGEELCLPAGTAHFLEHKMFENADGVDAFSLFAETGAIANAYTGFDRTSYIFTATELLEENLDILLSFVNRPHFTAETVEKEQGIIGQEIKMYQDNADTRLYFSLLESLYSTHPIRDDIVGSVESIATITPELLYRCCEVFYAPANMALCAAGKVTMAQLEAAAERAGLPAQAAERPRPLFPQEGSGAHRANHTLAMPVAMPMFSLGFKEKPSATPDVKREMTCHMLTELISGETSPLYRRLYDEGLVQPGFGGEYGQFGGALHMAFSGEGPRPETVRQAVLKEIDRLRREGIDAAQFETCKKMMYGDAIAELENVERVAYSLCSSYFRGRTPARELEAVAALSTDDLQQALEELLREEHSAFVVVEPDGSAPTE